NFKRGPEQRSHLCAVNLTTEEILSTINTQGEWSKVIKIDDVHGVAFVSNWHSNDVSIIDVSNPRDMKVLQVLPCGESPRGLVIQPDGTVIATNFFGRNIFS